MYKENSYYNFGKNSNLDLWKNPYGDDSYINLYKYRDEFYFTTIQNIRKGNVFGFRPGVHVGFGKFIIKDKWEEKGKYWNPCIFRYQVYGYYKYNLGKNYEDGLLSIGYPAKKATTSILLNYAAQVEKLRNPSYIAPYDKDDFFPDNFIPFDHLLYRLACERDPCSGDILEYVKLERYSVEKYLSKSEKEYGNEELKLCYLNPFEFRKSYAGKAPEKEKRWWHIFK